MGRDLAVQPFVYPEQEPRDSFAIETARVLAAQGFCVVDLGLKSKKQDILSEAKKEATALREAEAFYRPHELLVDGLLGDEGSAQIHELLKDESKATQNLKALDEQITELAKATAGYISQALGVDIVSRARAVLHETGPLEGVIEELTEELASRWLSDFTFGRILCVVCIGQGYGELELRPTEEESAKPFRVSAPPGTVLLVRSDLLSVRHNCRSRSFVLTAHWSASTKSNSRLPHSRCAERLSGWLSERLRYLKATETDDKRADLPRELRLTMNRQCFKGQYMAARGMSARMAPTWGTDIWWVGASAGLDSIVEVPLLRWDHEKFFEADDDSWRHYKTYSKHLSIVDGIELFDNKMFGITPAESKIMDPQQRVVLEVGYEGLFNAGYKKGRIMNSLGGIYLGYGSGTSDFSYVDRSTDCGAEGSFGATGGSAAITANRFSFCLGMKGPSIAVDADDASGLLSVHMGAEATHSKGRNAVNEFSVSGGIKLNMAAYYWPQKQSAGWLSKIGRCITFEASADGWVHGDACVMVVIKPLTEEVDGQLLVKEGEPYLASLCGSSVRHVGHGASMTAPHGPTEQEVISTAVYAAGLTGMDIDASECHGTSSLLCDPVEINSHMRVLRLADDDDATLAMMSAKSCMGNANHAAGAVSLIRAIIGSAIGYMPPNLHFQQSNPYVDLSDLPLNFPSEVMPYRMSSSFNTTFARGFGGTNVALVSFGVMEASQREKERPQEETQQATAQRSLMFWPGGGGELDNESMPRKGFHIAGSFSDWKLEPMKKESDGLYAYTLILGENRWEQFQIYLDGDSTKCLYPEVHKACEKTVVLGPDQGSAHCWRIDGRSGASEKSLMGRPGDKYKIILMISGRWRMVDWEKLNAPPAPLDSLKPSSFFINADFNGWGIEPMTAQGDGVFTFDVHLTRHGGQFQILRNRDFQQAVYPQSYSGHDPACVCGPDDCAEGRCFKLNGSARDLWHVELKPSAEDSPGTKEVHFYRTGTQELSEEQIRALGRLRLCAFGTWDAGDRLRELRWTGSYHQFFLELGPEGKESFQLLDDFNWNRVIHPSVPNAHSAVQHDVLGPHPADQRSRGLNWTIGLDGYEKAGDIFEVQVYGEILAVTKVRWQRVDRRSGAKMIQEAEEIGLLLGSSAHR